MASDRTEAGVGSKFRERAVAGVSSAEQLDRAIRVVSPQRWILLLAIVALVAGTVMWACLATIPTKVTGLGYLLPEGGLRQVEAGSDGTVRELALREGDHLIAGERIGTLVAPDGTEQAIIVPETGVAVEVDAVLHDQVAMGDRLAVIQPAGWPLVVYGYVPTSDAAGLELGTPVEVEFGAGIAEAYGFARGTVVGVSRFAATPERLAFVLQDTALVDAVRALGPSSEVLIRLENSAETPNGLVWGVGDGPATSLPAGLPADVAFVIGERHPIEDVL